MLTSAILVDCLASRLAGTPISAASIPYVVEAIAGVFLLLGLWTPLAGVAIAVVEIWTLLAFSGNLLPTITLASLGLTIAMIGPGMWSIDARLYGRKHLEAPRHLEADSFPQKY